MPCSYRTFSKTLTDCQFQIENRQTLYGQHCEIWHQERTATIFLCQIWKTPDIPQTDRIPNKPNGFVQLIKLFEHSINENESNFTQLLLIGTLFYCPSSRVHLRVCPLERSHRQLGMAIFSVRFPKALAHFLLRHLPKMPDLQHHIVIDYFQVSPTVRATPVKCVFTKKPLDFMCSKHSYHAIYRIKGKMSSQFMDLVLLKEQCGYL